MTQDAERWKEKYLKSVDRQDKLERRWNARLDLLRRGLVRSSLAAEGADRAVDQCMKEMREVVRQDEMDAGLASLIPRLEKAVLDSEQRREARVEQMATALTSLIVQLQSLQLPRDVAKPLRRLAKGVDERVTQAIELPLLLNELSQLQSAALKALGTPTESTRPGLLERLFGGRPAGETGPDAEPAPVEIAPRVESAVAAPDADPPKKETFSSADPAPIIEAAPPVAVQPLNKAPALEEPALEQAGPVPEPEPVPVPVPESEPSSERAEPVPAETQAEATPDSVTGTGEAEASAEPAGVPVESDPTSTPEATVATEASEVEPVDETEPEVDASEADPTYALPSSPEPSYSSVASHIEETLTGLLDELELPEHYRAQADDMHQRLENGLNWYELLPILDDLATLMLAVTNNGQHEFQAYLRQLNDRLDSFQSHLQAASAGHADSQSSARELDSQLREQVGGLQDSVQDATDLDTLKSVLDSRLETLIATMDDHQRRRDQREQEVTTRLQALSERVASMEQEAHAAQADLEAQRQKALVDALTGLPNRAAWNERLESEIAQLQNRRGNLLLGILDLDHFKRVNDNYGHLAGDKVLKIVATELRKRLRTDDFIARFGGEEFVLLLPGTALSTGLEVLDTLRIAIEGCPFHFKGEPVTITLSIGLTLFRAGERADFVLKRADQALYRAKTQGRNRIEHD